MCLERMLGTQLLQSGADSNIHMHSTAAYYIQVQQAFSTMRFFQAFTPMSDFALLQAYPIS